MEPLWQFLVEVLILLGAALALGALAEQLRQSAILGYLLAGTLVGPNVLGWVKSGENVNIIAELGVALLLFTIGLEFSFRKLRGLGRVALLGGTMQVLVTMAVPAAIAIAFDLQLRAAVAVGAMIALSSTAIVLRLLTDRAAMDSVYGRNCLGILLLQDIALIPLVLLMALLGSGGTVQETLMMLSRTVGLGFLLTSVFLVLFKLVVPRLLNLHRWTQNRELPILLAIIVGIGSAVAAHMVSISPAIGAFFAGILLGESPFAVQIRTDVSSIRTLLVTLFFASVGMVGEPVWVMQNWLMVVGVVAAILVGKTLITTLVLRMLAVSLPLSVATGLCIAQVGEFSFVLAEMAHGTVISEDLFRLIVSATIMTLFLSPLLVVMAPVVAGCLSARTRRLVAEDGTTASSEAAEKNQLRDTFIIGFGPAGQQAAQALAPAYKDRLFVVDLNPRNLVEAESMGLSNQVGDGTQRDLLRHTGLQHAHIVIVAVPDPTTSRTIIQHCKDLAPTAVIIARIRYHVMRKELEDAGALEIVDEEEQMGVHLAKKAFKYL